MKKNIINFVERFNDKEFKEKILPSFRKIRFNYKQPFIFDMETDISQEDYDYIFRSIFHGVIYRTLCYFHNKELTCTEYIEIFNNEVKCNTLFGKKVYKFKNEPILKLYTSKNAIGNNSEFIEPLKKEIIIKDTDELINKKLINKKKSYIFYKYNFFK